MTDIKKKTNIVFLGQRLEQWKESYISPSKKTIFSLSDQGNLRIRISSEFSEQLSMFDTVKLLSKISADMEKIIITD